MSWLQRLIGHVAALPLAIAVAGGAVSVGGAAWLHADIEQVARERYERAAKQVAYEIARSFDQVYFGLSGMAGMYAAYASVGSEEFRNYVEARDLPREFPGVRGFGFIERVMRADVDAFKASVLADGIPDFTIRQFDNHAHPELYLVRQIEPYAPNEASRGLDMGSEERRREGLERAIRTGQPTLSAPIMLVQDSARTPGFMLYLPVFRRGTDPSTETQRRRSLVGVLYAPIVAAELLRPGSAAAAARIGYALYFGDDAAQAADLAFDSHQPLGVRPGVAPMAGETTWRFEGTRVIEIMGRAFTLRTGTTSAFSGTLYQFAALLTLVGGLLMTALLAWLAYLSSSGRQRAEALARHMTVDLERLAQVVRHTSNAVAISDRELRINWVNEGFTRISGYTQAEALGRTPGELLGSDKADPAALRTLAESARTGVGCRVEVLNRAKDGREYWIDTEVQPLHDAHGELTGFMEVGSDITARKQAQAALHASQSFLDRTGRIGGVGGWALDLRTQARQWTDQTCRILEIEPGRQPTAEEVMAFYPPESHQAIQQAQQHSIASGEGFDLEVAAITAKGRPIWLRLVGEVEFADGRALRVVGALRDITERRARQAELHRTNEVLHSVLENLPCGLSVYDAQLQLVAANTEYRRLLDLPDALFATAPVQLADVMRVTVARGEFGPGDPAAILHSVLERVTRRSARHQTERLRHDGLPLEIRSAPMPGGGMVTTFSDISERKRNEQALLQRERLMRLVIDSFPGALAHWGADLRCTIANRAYQGWLGLDPQQMVGRTQRELFGETTFAANQASIAAVLRGEEQHLERSRLNPDGSTMHYQLHYVPDREGDAVSGFISVAIDVTPMKTIQIQLEERTAQAEQASVAKSRFLANMSHEIRTPMNAILGMLALLRKTELTPRQADYAHKTDGAARSLLHLLNEILDFSKVEAGKMSLDPHPFRIDQLLRDLSVIYSANLGGKPVEVLFDVDPALPRHLVGDAMRLQQVLINLGGNAIKFTAEGEVVITLAVQRRDAATVTFEISVRDTGIGIAPENQARIFSGFTQAEASTTRRYGGTGLGVSISQRLVALMGGELILSSTLGQGSRFHFCLTLPLAPETVDEAPVATLPPRPLRALVVDDNPTAREVLERMGQSLGWTVDMAASGQEALALLQAQVQAGGGSAYQAVFVDWQMPGLDGWETSRRIRNLGLAGQAPVVVMVTAHGREMLSQRSPAEQQLIDGFLVKPVTASMLFDAVVDARSGRGTPHPSQAARVTAPAGARRLAGLRLLVAEDNLNNQQVARELLEDEGAIVQIACHGQEAVEAIAAAEPAFDVVLMDLQMPVMDGFTATRRIRQDLGRLTLPIVAMTANAMASDREACLAAGMNEHVGKPFDLDHLVEVLRRLSPRHATGGADADPAAPALATGLSPAALAAAANAGLDVGAALARLGGNLGVYKRLLRNFVRDLDEPSNNPARQLEQGQVAEATRNLHTLKGLAATLGAAALARHAACAEEALAATPGASPAAGPLKAAIDALGACVEPLRAVSLALDSEPKPQLPEATGSATPQDRLEMTRDLEALAGLLRQSDMAAIDAMALLRTRFAATLGQGLEGLDDAVNGLDFDRAGEHCRDLLRAVRSTDVA